MTAAPATYAGTHRSVMLQEAIRYLRPRDGGIYVDGTFGAGGHSRALLEAAQCHVFAIDCDPYIHAFADTLSEAYGGRLTFLPGRFSEMERLLGEKGVEEVHGILLDIGVSSMQFDTPERGFSFSGDGPLDMRMSGEGRDAATLVNTAQERELADILFRYGGERLSRRIARAILEARRTAPITRTAQLADIIRRVAGRRDGIHPATQSFQALRIWVNDELGELSRALEASERLLAPEGRLAVITFHSGEDEIVKRFLRARSGMQDSPSRHLPPAANAPPPPVFRLITSRPVCPSEEEIERNPRARSARMRVAEKL